MTAMKGSTPHATGVSHAFTTPVVVWRLDRLGRSLPPDRHQRDPFGVGALRRSPVCTRVMTAITRAARADTAAAEPVLSVTAPWSLFAGRARNQMPRDVSLGMVAAWLTTR